MKLTVDCMLSAALLSQHTERGLAHLLAKGKVTLLAQPLEALLCAQYGLQAAPDYPIAAISAAADGLTVNHGDYWLRADAVHLVLQRDCFSLGEPVPLSLQPDHAAAMLASLNAHFAQDGLHFEMGKSGAWYLCTNTAPHIHTTLPSVALDKNIHPFMPQGQGAAQWKAMLNEVQMLLHEHPANQVREANGEVAVNSIWLSGGGVMPPSPALQQMADLVVASDVLSQGLAQWANVPHQTLTSNLAEILQKSAQHVRLQLPLMPHLDENWLQPLLVALKNNKIKYLTMNIGCYENTLQVEISPIDTYKFWRKIKPVMQYFK